MSKKKQTPIIAYKGFDADWKCRNFQYAVGKTYTHEGDVVACNSGFHACENPLNVFNYYPPSTSKFAVVEMGGEVTKEDGGNTKIAAASITIKAELTLLEIVKAGVEWILARAKKTKTNTGDYSAATNTGDWSAATNTGDWSAATNTGDWSAATNTGYQSAATNTGDYSAATNTGNYSAATNTGDYSAATNTGYQSAATNTGDCSTATNTGNQSATTNTGNQSAATNTGDYSAATNTGYRSAATNTGYQSAATNTGYQSAASVEGKESTAIATGIAGRVMAKQDGCSLFCNEWSDQSGVWELISPVCGMTGRDGIKAGVWYTAKGGKLVETEE